MKFSSSRFIVNCFLAVMTSYSLTSHSIDVNAYVDDIPLESNQTFDEVNGSSFNILDSARISTNPKDYPTIKKNGLVGNLTDSKKKIQTLTFEQAIKDDTDPTRIIVQNKITTKDEDSKDHYYALELYRQSGSQLKHYDTCRFGVAGASEFTLGCSIPAKDFLNQEYLYLRFGIANKWSPNAFSAVKTYKVKNPYYQLNTITSVKVDSLSGVVGSSVKVTASSISGSYALYKFQVTQNGNWVTLQEYSNNRTLEIPLTSVTAAQRVKVLVKDSRSSKSHDDYEVVPIRVYAEPTEASHVASITQFNGDLRQLNIVGYSYLKGVQTPLSSDLNRKLEVVDYNSKEVIQSVTLTNSKTTSFTNGASHGNGLINYDWAKFQGQLNLSELPFGTYQLQLETESKGYIFKKVIPFGSSIADFSYTEGMTRYEWKREKVDNVSTLLLSVVDLTPQPEPEPEPTPPPQEEQPSTPTPPSVPINSDYIKNVSRFEIRQGLIYMEGYSYVKGIEIPKSHNILHKLKITDATNKRTIGVYDLTNIYTKSLTNSPSHGNGLINYDWAKFSGELDISDLPVGEFHVKIYTNAKGEKREEVIKFQSSITNFSFVANHKLFEFERSRVNDIPTMILKVSNLNQ